MESTFITTVLNDSLHYIAIKLIEKQTDDTKYVIEGLFKGIVSHKDKNNKKHTFILTEQQNEKSKNVVSGLNIEYYDILSIKIENKEYTVNVFATKENKDQERTRSILTLCLETLKVSNMMVSNDNNLVNINLYTHVPLEISKKKVIDTTTTYDYKNLYKPTPKAVPEPTFFKSKDISKEDINKMKLKLDLILTDTFVPVMPKTNSGKEEITTKYQNNYGNMGSSFGYM